jgi:PAS domain S-box-containing protein
MTHPVPPRDDEADHYRLLFGHNPHPMWAYDVETWRFLAANQAAVDHYGYSEAEFLAMTIRDIRPVEDVPRLTDRMKGITLAGKLVGTWRHQKKDGAIIDVEVVSDAITFAGRPARLILAHDVTARLAAERLLRDSEERFRQLAENIAEVFWIWDVASDRLEYVSPAYAHVWGRPVEELAASPNAWIDAIHPDDRERVRAGLRKDQVSGKYDQVYRVVRPDGSLRWIHDRAFPVRDHEGVVFRVVGTALDVTNSRVVEARLIEQAALLDQANDAIMVRDLDHNILYWNQSATRLFGWSRGEALSQNARDLLAVEPADYHLATQALLTHGEWIGELEKQARDRKVTVSSRWTLVRDSDGRPKSVLVIDTDITGQRRAQELAFRAQRLESVGTLAGGIAHDLNNILAPIIMSIESLREIVTDEDTIPLLDILNDSAHRGADLVRHVLLFARGADGDRVPVSLTPLIKDLLKVLRDTFPKSIDIQLAASEQPWSVSGDPTQLHQVLMNLCVNARDAMPTGGRLLIGVENVVLDETYATMNADARLGGYVKVTVEDSGTGIPKDVRDRMFEPFFTTKEVGRGTGLGLSTTLAILRSHRGFADVDSEPGKGTKFHFYLPASVAGPEVLQVEVQQRRLPMGRGDVVLVVDDEAAIREVARRTLERYGYRVLLASNGAEAVAMYAREGTKIAVIVTDMAMPIMDGPALIVALRAIHPDVKIIASSGMASSDGVARALGAGIEEFVHKPYTAEVLLTTVARILRGRTSGGSDSPS